MDSKVDYEPFLKALSGADPIQARRFAAAKALEIGWGGVSEVSTMTGFSRNTINKGIQELVSNDELKQPERLRKPGGGRKRAENREPTLLSDLEGIMNESTAGDPMSLLKWTHKSTYAIAEELKLKGHKVSHDTVRRLLKEDGYSLQANRKTLEGKSVPERDSQAFRSAKDATPRSEMVRELAELKEEAQKLRNELKMKTRRLEKLEADVYKARYANFQEVEMAEGTRSHDQELINI
jgi:transposase